VAAILNSGVACVQRGVRHEPCYSNVSSVTWRFMWTEVVLKITTQKITYKTFSFILRANCWSLDLNVSKRTWIFTIFFRNVCSPTYNKDITAFLRHPEQCLIPSPQIAFCFTNLSRLVLEKFKFFEKNAQNLNTPAE